MPTGSSSTQNPGPQLGTYFGHKGQNIKSRVNLLVSRGTQTVNGASVNRGTRVALTFQPDQLTSRQRSQIASSLGLSSGGQLFNNEPYQNIVVSTSTLEQIQKVLNPPAQPSGSTYPYPGTPAPGDTLRTTPWQNRSYIATDTPAQGYPRYKNGTIPPVLAQATRDFALYLVILGVVIACVELVFVGAMMAFGHSIFGQ